MANVIVQQKSNFWRNALIIIIIGLLIWQYALPMVIPSIKTPTDYFDDYFISPDLSSASYLPFLMDTTTSNKTLMSDWSQSFSMDSFHNYRVGIQADLPGALVGSYRLTYDIITYNTSSGDPGYNDTYHFGIDIPAYQCYYTSQWFIQDTQVIFNYNLNYRLSFNLYDLEGNNVFSNYDTYGYLMKLLWSTYPAWPPVIP